MSCEGLKIIYKEQLKPAGLPQAFTIGEKFIGKDNVSLILGANFFYGQSLTKKLQECVKLKTGASVLLHPVKDPSLYGIASINKKNKITKIIEKPKNPPTNLAVTGIYFLTTKFFDIFSRLKPSWRNELEITDALQMMLEEDNIVNFEMITDYWKDTGTPDDIIHANGEVLRKEAEKQNTEERFESMGIIYGEGSTIDRKNVHVNGPVLLGKNCHISSGSIGPNVSVGDNSKLINCNIQNSIIMENCVIDSNMKIRDSIIASNSSITTDSNNDEKVLLLGEGTKISL